MVQRIIRITDEFKTQEAYDIYKSCMYLPTAEKFCKVADEFLADKSVIIYASYCTDIMTGIIAVKLIDDNMAEILGIAVTNCFQRQGLGQSMIQYVFRDLNIDKMLAETDNDAVDFYKKSGFDVSAFTKEYADGMCIRYSCVLVW